MLGDGGTCDRVPEVLGNLAGAQLLRPDESQNLSPPRFDNCLQGRIHARSVRNHLRKCQLTNGAGDARDQKQPLEIDAVERSSQGFAARARGLIPTDELPGAGRT